MKRKDRARLPESKRRRLFLKEERSTSKGGNEAIEGLSYQSEIGLSVKEEDIEKNSRSCAKAQLFLLFKFEKLLSTQCCYFRSGNHWPDSAWHYAPHHSDSCCEQQYQGAVLKICGSRPAYYTNG